MTKFHLTAALLLLGIAFTSCKKDHSVSTVQLQVEADNSTAIIPVIAPRTSLPLLPTKTDLQNIFDWETTSYMPQPADKPKIPVPWSDEARRMYNPALRYDYKKADGWELVYNTFSASLNTDVKIFMLYNKFRGVIRNYVYVAANFNTLTDFAKHNIYANEVQSSLENSKILNFADQLIVDVEKSAMRANYYDPFVLANNSWYVTEYELAFDPTLANNNSTSRLQYTNEFISLSGSINNKTVDASANNIAFQSTEGRSVEQFPNGDIGLRLVSDLDLDKYSGYLSTAAASKIKTEIAFTTGIPNLYSALLVPGTTLNTIKIPAKASFQPPLSRVLFSSPSTAIPGINNAAVIGYGPVFNETPGIFFLEKKPEVRSTRITGTFSNEYSIVANSLVYQFNPFIDAYASVESIDQEIVAVEDVEDLNLSEAILYHGRILRSNKPLKILGIRVKFNVVPKNGSKRITIVKTFAVNELK